MKQNSRLSLALHTLSHMAADPDRAHTSARIAAHADTNPVVVRRVLGRLRKAGLLSSEKGHAGGWRLARSPHSITLADVYLALDERLIAAGPVPHEGECQVEYALRTRIYRVLADAEHNLVERLRETSIAAVESADTLPQQAGPPRPARP